MHQQHLSKEARAVCPALHQTVTDTQRQCTRRSPVCEDCGTSAAIAAAVVSLCRSAGRSRTQQRTGSCPTSCSPRRAATRWTRANRSGVIFPVDQSQSPRLSLAMTVRLGVVPRAGVTGGAAAAVATATSSSSSSNSGSLLAAEKTLMRI